MNRFLPSLTFLVGVITIATACVHTTPGISVELAIAKKAALVALPATPTPKPIAAQHGDPSVPKIENREEDHSSEAFQRGEFCMNAGKNEEAVTAFREAVKLSPRNQQAWYNLAIVYERTGQSAEALDAFRKSKEVSKH